MPTSPWSGNGWEIQAANGFLCKKPRPRGICELIEYLQDDFPLFSQGQVKLEQALGSPSGTKRSRSTTLSEEGLAGLNR